MKPEDLQALLSRLSSSAAKPATADQISVLVESIAYNRLTDPEIMRGYHASRDGSQWFTRPSEFLALARPAVSAPVVMGEAETIFQLLLDHPLKYGTYNPETGTVWDRRKIEAAHGRAAGEAFGAVQGRFRTMETLADEKWVRKAFVDAYAEARADHGAPLALTPPSRRLEAPAPAQALTGQTEEESKAAEAQKRFSEIIRGGPTKPAEPVDFDARMAALAEQGRQLREAVS